LFGAEEGQLVAATTREPARCGGLQMMTRGGYDNGICRWENSRATTVPLCFNYGGLLFFSVELK